MSEIDREIEESDASWRPDLNMSTDSIAIEAAKKVGYIEGLEALKEMILMTDSETES